MRSERVVLCVAFWYSEALGFPVYFFLRRIASGDTALVEFGYGRGAVVVYRMCWLGRR